MRNEGWNSYLLMGVFLVFFLVGVESGRMYTAEPLPLIVDIDIAIAALVVAEIWTR